MLGKNQRSSRPQMGHVQLEQQYSIVARWRTSIGFKLAVYDNTGAGGLVVPLPCTACFSKLAVFFGCSLPQQA